jgi:hypothetical protein
MENRIMKNAITNHLHRSAVLLTAAIIFTATLISVHGAGSNGATKVEFSARQDNTWPYPFHIIDWGQRVDDGTGRKHIRNRIWTNPLWYTIGDGEETAVRGYTVYNSIIGKTGNVEKHGRMAIFTGGVDDVPTDETTLWEGNWHGMSDGAAYSGKFQLQGRGDFAGTKIVGTTERCLDCAPSRIFFLAGQVLYPQGE